MAASEMGRVWIAIFAGAALAVACSPQPDGDALDQGEVADNAVAPGAAMPPDTTLIEGQQPFNAEAAAPEGAQARYVGRWATDETQCRTRAWRLEERKLTTREGLSCDFGRVTQVAGGYDVEAECSADGRTAPDAISIRFAESARAMLIESRTFGEHGVVPCP